MANLPKSMKKNAVVLQKPSGTIAVRVELNAIQRKFYNALLYIAKHDLKQNGDKKTFTILFEDLKAALDKKKDRTKNDDYYIEKLKELKLKNAEYDILDKDGGREWGMFSLVSDLSVKSKKGLLTKIYFEIPERVKNALLDPDGIYANINLVVVRGLKSKYAIILYELVKDYEKVEIPEMTIEKFKELFGVKGRYSGRVDNLKRKVLKPAIEELNNSPHIDFTVDCGLRKTGPKYTHIKFIVKPKPKELKNKQKVDKMLVEYAEESPELKDLLALIPKDLRKKRRIIGLILGSLEKKGEKYTEAQIKYVMDKYEDKKIKNVEAYLKKAIENDYASFETIEIGDLEVLTYNDLIGVRVRNGEANYEITKFEKKDDGLPEEMRTDDYIVYLKPVDGGDTVIKVWSKNAMDRMLEKLREIKKKKNREKSK